MRKQFNELGDFNSTQTAAFEASLGTYHVWHRQSELPQYAALIQQIADSISTKSTTRSKVVYWIQQSQDHSLALRECHPVNFLFDLIKSLSDEQLVVIENNFRKKRAENKRRSASRTPEEWRQRRLKNIEKWAGRLDLKITEEQREILRTAFQEQISLREQYSQLSAGWNEQFFNLARNQQAPEYDDLMSSHLSTLWTLIPANYPEQWQKNLELWKDVAFRFEQSMTADQRIQFSRWMSKMADTLVSISKDKPSFRMGDDPSVGCMLNQQES